MGSVFPHPEIRLHSQTNGNQVLRLAHLRDANRRRNYYDVYYQRMYDLATATEIKLALQALKTSHQSLLAQPRVRPSPTPEGATPTPAVAPAKKKQAQKHKKKVHK